MAPMKLVVLMSVACVAAAGAAVGVAALAGVTGITGAVFGGLIGPLLAVVATRIVVRRTG